VATFRTPEAKTVSTMRIGTVQVVGAVVSRFGITGA
jgi:hypothetical protein